MTTGLATARARRAVLSRTTVHHAGTAFLVALVWCSAAVAGGPRRVASATRTSSPAASPSTSASTPATAKTLPEVSVQAPEPRYVAPTLRDQIGRIWAPVYLDGKGPFRLVLDTGATQSAVTARVAKALGTPLNPPARSVVLHGVTGTVVAPTITVSTLRVGDLQRDDVRLPIVPDALGGADGVLGTQGLRDKRIYIDFRSDRITIRYSYQRRAPPGYVTIPLEIRDDHLLTTNARVGRIPVTAIIDTGSQTSIANLALRRALLKRRSHYHFSKDQIVDATDAVAKGEGTALPPIYLAGIEISGSHITTGNMHIFKIWHLMAKPAILIGMDALGRVDVLIIDYRMHELQIRTHYSGLGPPVYTSD